MNEKIPMPDRASIEVAAIALFQDSQRIARTTTPTLWIDIPPETRSFYRTVVLGLCFEPLAKVNA